MFAVDAGAIDAVGTTLPAPQPHPETRLRLPVHRARTAAVDIRSCRRPAALRESVGPIASGAPGSIRAVSPSKIEGSDEASLGPLQHDGARGAPVSRAS